MSTENWLDFLGISMDPRKADGMRFTINLVTPDNGEKYLVEMSNATLTNIKGVQASKPDLTITVNRADLNLVMMGASSFDDLIKAGKAKFDGDRKPFDQLRGPDGHVRAELRDPAGNGPEDAEHRVRRHLRCRSCCRRTRLGIESCRSSLWRVRKAGHCGRPSSAR